MILTYDFVQKKEDKIGGYGSGRTSKVGRRAREKSRVEWLPCLNSFKCMPGRLAKINGVSSTTIGRYIVTTSKDFLEVHSLKKDLIFKTPMQTINSGFGLRYFFTCPHCFKRTSRLYCALKIGCRKCLNLSYHSQNISNEDRWLLKRERLLDRYGMSFENANSSIKKKGMHRKTFDKFMSEYNFINEMGINIHLDRFDYKRVLALLREGKEMDKYLHSFNNLFFDTFQHIEGPIFDQEPNEQVRLNNL